MQAVIRYCDCGEKEYFTFYIRMNEDDDWELESAFPIVDDMIHYTCLTKVRELQHYGYKVFFGSDDTEYRPQN